MSKYVSRQRGFTIVELLLAMTIFSFLMVTITVAFRQIMSSYRGGVVRQRTQETAREVIDVMTKEMRASDSFDIQTINNPYGYFFENQMICFSTGRYVYYQNWQVDSNDNVTQLGRISIGSQQLPGDGICDESTDRNTSTETFLVDGDPVGIAGFIVEEGYSNSGAAGIPPTQLGLTLQMQLVNNEQSLKRVDQNLVGVLERHRIVCDDVGSEYCAETYMDTAIGLR